jgi:ankyrin repeat protein
MSGLRTLIFSIVFLISCNVTNGQWELIVPKKNIIDTSAYLPYFYNGALDYNLLIAASEGYTSEIERLIKKGADIEVETSQGATPLVLAVSNNKLNAVMALLAHHPVVDKVTRDYETPLMVAAKFDYQQVAEKLIRAGANVNFQDAKSATPLHYTSLYGYLVLSDLLIYYDANMDLPAIDGSTPIHGAVAAGNSSVVDLLIQRGANIEAKDNQGLTPYLTAAFYGDTILMDLLQKNGANIHAEDNKGYNALSLTVLGGQKEAIDYLLKLGTWENQKVDPYMVAIKYNRKDILKILSDNKVPGKIRYKIDQASLSLSERFSIHDIYTGMSISFREPLMNIGFTAGVDTKLWATRVLYKYEQNRYYQFYDKGSLVYAGVFKDFKIKEYADLSQLFFTTSLSGGYAFGNNLKGSTMETDKGFRLIPSAGFRLTRMKLSLNLNMEYIHSKFYHTGPIWLRAGISYNYYLDDIRTRIKPIRWYKQ